MDPLELLRTLGLALLLGLLVGLQREWSKHGYAGFRTFPLVTVFGALCAVFAREYDVPWMLPAGFAGVATLVLVGNFPLLRSDAPDVGVTTEAALFVMFAVGALTVYGPWAAAIVVAGSVAVLLYLKPQLHGFAERIGETDFRAIMQFVLITFIILPVLPRRHYDPLALVQPLVPNRKLPELAVLNPFEIWLLVVLVVGISLAAYVAYKLLGRRAGTLLGGILGGAISSTATTISYARQARSAPEMSGLAAVVILIAGTVTFVRMAAEIAVASPRLLQAAIGPLAALFAVSALLAGGAWLLRDKNGEPDFTPRNPSELKFAIIFAVTYSIVLVAVAIGRTALSTQALYVIAALSGLMNVDAITLSTARLVESERVEPDFGWRVVMVGALSNVAFKGLLVLWLGDAALRRRILLLFGLLLAGGVALLVLWP